MYICNMKHKALPVKGLEYYTVSESGDITNTKKNHVRRPGKDGSGYLQVNFMINTKRISYKIHRLVALAFIPNNTGYNTINHIDGNKLNNHYTNLEWCSPSQNRLHASRILGHNTSKHLFKKGNSINKKGCEVIKGPKPGVYQSFKEAGEANGTSGSYLSQIVRKGVKSTQFIVKSL